VYAKLISTRTADIGPTSGGDCMLGYKPMYGDCFCGNIPVGSCILCGTLP